MTSLMPETIPPVEQSPNSSIYEDPAPKAKTPRKSWTQAQVAALASAHASGIAVVHELVPFSETERKAKLVELGLLQKPAKATLSGEGRDAIDDVLRGLDLLSEPERTLAIRYALNGLRGLKATK